MWKKTHPSGAWSSLKLTLYVICKANCNHRDHFCCHSQSPLKFLSLCLVLWVLPFLLFSLSLLSSIYFAFNVPLFFFIPVFLSVASFYSHRLCHFLFLCLGLSLFFCFVVTSPLCSTSFFFVISLLVLVFLHTVIDTHAHTDTHIPFLWSPWSQREYDFQNPHKKKSLAQNIHRALFHLK